MKNKELDIIVKSNRPSEDALKNFAKRVMEMYYETKEKTQKNKDNN